MKEYKNVTLSLCFYVLGFVVTYVLPSLLVSVNGSLKYGYVFIIVSLLLVAFGIFFAYKASKNKESDIASNLLMLIGVLIIFGFFYIQSVCTPAYNCQ
ncbi:MAG: hypothetical protein WCV79_01185 [Candidatus Paceibacterota bacterium]|jgi:membrane protease YdiL (CAAX protease family)